MCVRCCTPIAGRGALRNCRFESSFMHVGKLPCFVTRSAKATACTAKNAVLAWFCRLRRTLQISSEGINTYAPDALNQLAGGSTHTPPCCPAGTRFALLCTFNWLSRAAVFCQPVRLPHRNMSLERPELLTSVFSACHVSQLTAIIYCAAKTAVLAMRIGCSPRRAVPTHDWAPSTRSILLRS
jgi:hypothetical protein